MAWPTARCSKSFRLRRVAELVGSGSVAALARDAERAVAAVPPGVAIRVADYDDRSALTRALAGVTRLLFVASDGAASDVIRQHANVIDAAGAAAVEQIVFTSIVDVEADSPFYFAPVYRDAERRLHAGRAACTILRCGLYSDFVVSHWIEPARASGVIDVPAGRAQIAPINRNDVAEVAAAALVSGAWRGQVHALTGPRAHTFYELAAAASEAFGVSIVYHSCAPAEYLARCRATMHDPWPQAFASPFASIEQQRYAPVTAGVETLIGHVPQPFETLLSRER
jgi:NAD(P)H dehydrogenase (quinone)